MSLLGRPVVRVSASARVLRLSGAQPRVAAVSSRLYASSPIEQPEKENEQTNEPPPLKAQTTSKLWAFAIGGSLALAYAAYKRNRTPQQQGQAGSLDGFIKYTLQDKEAVSSTCSIFTIAPLTGKKPRIDLSEHPRSIQSILIKQPDLQIARSYTILPPLPDQPDDAIRLLIRREKKGEVSGYLHDIAIGSDVEIRGPYTDFTLPNDTANVIFIAGGTGIAPALKTAALLQDTANVHVLWASRKAEDCAGATSDTRSTGILASTLSAIGLGQQDPSAAAQDKNTLVLMFDILKLQKHNDKTSLTIDYFVDEQQSYMRPKDVAKHISASSPSGSNVIIVSGPDGFIYHWAGAKEWIDGRLEQGRLGGVLSKLDLKGWQVVKL